jgi:WXG100 family type VII secretion target
MAQFRVSSDSLASASGRLEAGSSEVQGTLAHLRSVVDALGPEWEGAASGAFTELYSEFNSAALRLNESLSGIADLLGRAAISYAESEANVAHAFRG